MLNSNSSRNKGNENISNTSSNVNVPKDISETDDFKRQPPEEHLKSAKSLYGTNPNKDSVENALKHLKAIPESASEYKETQSLLKKVEKTKKDIEEKEEIDKQPLEITGSKWRRGAFGAAGIWTVTFYNRSERPVGDIEYKTRYFSETGNNLGGTGGIFSSGEIQKIIPPKQKRAITINDGFINREAVNGTFEVTGWRFVNP